jgi:hypothetical protein
MVPENELTCSQEPATGPNPETDESTAIPSPISLRSILMLSSHLRLGLPSFQDETMRCCQHLS